MHSWPQLAMASALHRQNSSTGDYLSGLPAQFLYLGLLVAPLVIAGFIMLWRTPELRFIGLACTVVLVYVLAWVPGKVYYGAGIAPAVLAAGSGAAERWLARARRPRLWRGIAVAAPLAGLAVVVPGILPVLPVDAVHDLPASYRSSDPADTIGWPQLTRAVMSRDAPETGRRADDGGRGRVRLGRLTGEDAGADNLARDIVQGVPGPASRRLKLADRLRLT